MRIWIVLGMAILRMPPLALLALAGLILAGGGVMQHRASLSNLDRAAAVAAGPPAQVEAGAYDRGTDRTALDEVHLRGQLDFSWDHELTLEGRIEDRHAYMIPLLAQGATDGSEVLGVVLYDRPGQGHDVIDPMDIYAEAKGMGVVGPIVAFNGTETGSLGRWASLVRDSFEDTGHAMPADMLVLRPFDGDRAAALAPRSAVMHWIPAGVAACLLVLLAVLRMTVLRGAFPAPRPREEMPEWSPGAPVAGSDRPRTQYHIPKGQEAPMAEWQKRLAEKTRAGTLGTSQLIAGEGEVGAAAAAARRHLPRRRTPEGRIGMILGMAGFAAMVLIAVSALVSNREGVAAIVDFRFAEAVASLPIEESDSLVATMVAGWVDSRLGLDAPRPEVAAATIDLTPVAYWLVNRAWGAAHGNGGDIALLALILLGPFVALFVWLTFIRLRRAYTPKVTARISSMGIN
ncbi:hypothetical protein [Wenxinia saemankumensis]|uniref:Uncharacterized protein n=1 Tax=Wenxinia saemankumensis TaxID=1447782 RepID=A0A1M6ERZ6_9RHOB|nr:hypothetical protein [Wenxinia saemankumensis]SHI88227.1 hypothetical protein SAMN05444417_2143 [Wenxinia saemankumensis]